MPLVTRLGPIELLGAPPTYVYVELRDGEISNLTLGEDHEDILKKIARTASPGEPRECSPDLSAIAKPLGFTPVAMPPDALGIVAGYAVSIAGQTLHSPLLPVSLFRNLGFAFAEMLRARPWRYWSVEADLRVTTSGWDDGRFWLTMSGDPPGISLEDARMVPDAPRDEIIAAMRQAVPAFVRPWLNEAFGLDEVPVVGRLLPNEDVEPVDLRELMTIIATLRAAAQLSPQKTRASAHEEYHGKLIRVDIEAPRALN